MDDVEALREAVAEPLAAAGVCFSYLFGSRTRGDTPPGSDTDIAVRFEPGIPPRRAVAAGPTSRHRSRTPRWWTRGPRGPRRGVVPSVGRIATEGVILTGHDQQERVRFETDIVPRYLDSKYHADRLDRMIPDEMAAGRR